MEVETQGGGCLDLFAMALGVVGIVVMFVVCSLEPRNRRADTS